MRYVRILNYPRWVSAAVMIVSSAGATQELEEVRVVGRGQPLTTEERSASEGTIGQMDLAIRPLLRPGDVLEAIPGLIVTQHSGSGKSNQLFLRGFNLDHGTDFSTAIDGMPVNLPSHGHGQGYTDINFLIPETVQRMDYVKGPYHAELGDFSSAGGVSIQTFDALPTHRLSLGLGGNGFFRALAMGTSVVADTDLTGAFEVQSYDGPWTDIREDVGKINGLLKVSGGNDVRSWSVTGMYYDNTWNSADQIPERAVTRGLIDPLGSLDTSLGGASRRASLSTRYVHNGSRARSEWHGYAIDYALNLWSNFTYLLDDPLQGDQFQQRDERRIFGGGYDRGWQSGADAQFSHRVGSTLRFDNIATVGLYRTQNRRRTGVVREDSVDQLSASVFYELSWQLAASWRGVVGVRGDHYRFDVVADDAVNSGSRSDAIVSPKASLIYTLSSSADAYLSAGYGFHSNDARGTTIRRDPVSGAAVQRVDPLVRSRGVEMGIKARWFDSWNSTLVVWSLALDSELLFVGDAGSTESSRPSERWGVEFNNFWAISDIWSLEADFAWTDARFSDQAPSGRAVPGALKTVISGAVSAQYPSGWFGSLRWRYFGAAPLTEDRRVTSNGSSVANFSLGWADDSWGLRVDALNLLNSDDHDIDYFYPSRLAGEPAEGIEDVHFHVLEPRQVRLYVSRNF